MHLHRNKPDTQAPADNGGRVEREWSFFAAHFGGVEGVLVRDWGDRGVSTDKQTTDDSELTFGGKLCSEAWSAEGFQRMWTKHMQRELKACTPKLQHGTHFPRLVTVVTCVRLERPNERLLPALASRNQHAMLPQVEDAVHHLVVCLQRAP